MLLGTTTRAPKSLVPSVERAAMSEPRIAGGGQPSKSLADINPNSYECGRMKRPQLLPARSAVTCQPADSAWLLIAVRGSADQRAGLNRDDLLGLQRRRDLDGAVRPHIELVR